MQVIRFFLDFESKIYFLHIFLVALIVNLLLNESKDLKAITLLKGVLALQNHLKD